MSKGLMLHLSLEEAQLIGNALAELPWRVSNALIQSIQGQVNLQMNEPEPKPKEAVE